MSDRERKLEALLDHLRVLVNEWNRDNATGEQSMVTISKFLVAFDRAVPGIDPSELDALLDALHT